MFHSEDIFRLKALVENHLHITLPEQLTIEQAAGLRITGIADNDTLIALYAGLQLWGIGGMILAPVLTVIAIRLTAESPDGI